MFRRRAEATKAENEAMTILSGNAQRDSQTIKILIVVALIYVPSSSMEVSALLVHELVLSLTSGSGGCSLGILTQTWFKHERPMMELIPLCLILFGCIM